MTKNSTTFEIIKWFYKLHHWIPIQKENIHSMFISQGTFRRISRSVLIEDHSYSSDLDFV